MNHLAKASLKSKISSQLCTWGLAALFVVAPVWADSSTAEAKGQARVEDLIQSPLEVWAEGEVLVTRFQLPAGHSSQKHSHPGEGFLYVIEGSMILHPEGGKEVTVGAGEIVKIPMGQVHRAGPGANGVSGIVFRVHPEGLPERQLVD